jgi:hypothetical protein
VGLNAVVYFLTTSFPPELGHLRVAVPPADWRVVLFLVLGAMASTLFFALAPALQATRVELVRAIRGEVSRDARPGRARNALVAVQVTGAVLLLICAAVLLRSTWAASTIDAGINVDGVLTVTILNGERRSAVLDTLRSEPAIETVGATWPGRLQGLGGLPAYAEGTNGASRVTYTLVSPEYFEVLGIDLVRGRNFTSAEDRAGGVGIVSEEVARQLWPGADPIGQVLRVEPPPPSELPLPQSGTGEENAAAGAVNAPPPLPRSVVVVGVARDVRGFRIGSFRIGSAGVYMPTTAAADGTALTLRVRGDA